MPITAPNTPGVQINEVRLEAPPIVGAGTSTAAFVGAAPKRGQFINQVRIVTSPDQFVQDYIVDTKTTTLSTQLSRAVLGFFANGGGLCYVVNVDSTTAPTATLPAPEPTAPDVVKGIDLLKPFDDVRILAAPGQVDPTVYSELTGQAELLGDRFAILDPPAKVTALTDLTTPLPGGKHPASTEYAAFYYSRIMVGPQLSADPAADFVTPVGHIAGVYARVDANRGVFKAPANEVLRGVLGVEHLLTDADQNFLNPAGVNVLRVFSGNVTLWGARTLETTDSLFLYISTRRFVNFVETSLQNGLRFAVFEPNNLTLRQQIVRSVRGFLNRLWAEGALFGLTADDAYYVRFPPLLNTDTDRAQGRLTVEIGLRVTFPAEFVVINIGVILNSPISA